MISYLAPYVIQVDMDVVDALSWTDSILLREPCVEEDEMDLDKIPLIDHVDAWFIKATKKMLAMSYGGVLTFGSFPPAEVPLAANRRFIQVLHAMMGLDAYHRIFDTDASMLISLRNEVLSDTGCMASSEVLKIPQRSIRHAFLTRGSEYSKIVQYVTQVSTRNAFSKNEINSLLGHLSKKGISFSEFPRLMVCKQGSKVFICLKNEV